MSGGLRQGVAALVERLSAAGVHYVCCSMVDTGGINRVKCVPIEKLGRAAHLGIGMPLSWSMAMSNDHFARSPRAREGPAATFA